MTQEEITENERLWREEQGARLAPATDSAAEMRSAGITPGAMSADLGAQSAEAPADMAAAAEGKAWRSVQSNFSFIYLDHNSKNVCSKTDRPEKRNVWLCFRWLRKDKFRI